MNQPGCLWVIISILVFGIPASNVRTADDVFAVSPVYSLRPDGICQEIRGGLFGSLAERNSHWDAKTRTIKLTAARNEEVAIQLVIPKAGKALAARMSDLAGPGIIPANRATLSALLWVKASNGILCPDLVIPLDGSVNDLRSFDVPVGFDGLPRANNSIGTMLLEIWVPKTAQAGCYVGTLDLLSRESSIATLKIELTVFDFDLPDVPTFAFDLLDYGMPAEGLGLAGSLNGDGLDKNAKRMSAEFKSANYQIYKLAADNRCFLNVLPYSSQRGSPRFAPPISGKGSKAKVMSWEEYDDLFAPILEGRCNKYGGPPMHFTLPFNVNYPHLCDSEPKRQFDWTSLAHTIPAGPGLNHQLAEFEATNRTVAQEFVRHFAERGWTRTRFEIFHNQKADPDRNRIPWKLDEPIEEADYQALRYLFNTSRWSFEGAADKHVQIVTRLDIGHFHCDKMLTPKGEPAKDYKAKEFDSHHAPRYLMETTDHWAIGIVHAEGAQHLLANYDGPGRKLMVYGTAGDTALDQHYGQFAGECIRLARMGVVGRVVYKVDIANGNPNAAGQHYVLYDGKSSIGFAGALASRRLKLWRDSVNLFDYISAARKKNTAAVDALLEKMVRIGPSADLAYRQKSGIRGFWINNNVEDLALFKLKLAEIVTSTKLGVADLQGFSEAFTPCGSPDRIVAYD